MCFGSGLDPDSIGDPDWESGSGLDPGWPKISPKKGKMRKFMFE
jgi:hypothetical protein